MPAAEIPIHSNLKVKISSPWGFPLREDLAFTDSHGADGHRYGKFVKRALKLLQEPLRKILLPEEVVLYLGRGQLMPEGPERYMLGAPYRILARTGLILTNRRLLCVSMGWEGRWHRNLRYACWGDVEAFNITGRIRGRLLLKYRNGNSETYWHIPKLAAEKLQIILDAVLAAPGEEVSVALGMANFCPQCLAQLTPEIYICPNCRVKFKNERGVLLHALLIPGGGYFYAGLNLLGIAHAFIDVGILASVIVWILAAMGRVRPPPMPGVPPVKWVFVFSATILSAFLALDIWLAIRVAQRAVRNFTPII